MVSINKGVINQVPSGGVTAIVQARLSSSRLPGKVLMRLGGQTILETLILRLQKASSVKRIIIATSDQASDDRLATYISRHKMAELFRGSLQNVFSRYQTLASEVKTPYILRITADCPYVCPEMIDALVESSLQGDWDFVSNSHKYGIIKGFDLESFKRQLILSIPISELNPYEAEHVTPRMYQIEKTRILLLEYPDLINFRNLNFSVDTLGDYNFLNALEKKYRLSRMTFQEIRERVISKLDL